MAFFYFGGYDPTPPPPPTICDTCGEPERDHSTPFYCDQTPVKEREVSWFQRADDLLDEIDRDRKAL